MPGHGEVVHTQGSGAIGTDHPWAWTSYTCGWCGKDVSGAVLARVGGGPVAATEWARCTACGAGTVIVGGALTVPGALFGPEIQGLPEDVGRAYAEVRRCMSVNGFTAAELVCRKLLMHVAVDKADGSEGDTFASYVSALEVHGYITPAMKPWVTMIRENANAATHELPEPSKDRAESTVWFTAELLRIVYEMEHLQRRFAPLPAPDEAAPS